ncbi:proteinase inhibitor [Bacillus sp. HMF5848]|uniref:BsuPI-related putative proteinase inhibitor n=1 Tax=Bacillus sp. HMF5848 TaxID=2495421 RepID=UPI000F7A6506|nr:BsuPI-related putative proteinase inhibitor [Bacillus sp. HMF5848]RSK28909.1 proteinase inhibitor [Bacillus sp. HMF5848]
MKKLFIMMAVALFAIAGCSTTTSEPTPNDDESNDGGGIVAGTLEPSLTYEETGDGTYTFFFKVKNQTEQEQTLTFTSGQRFEYKLYKDGEHIYTYSMDKSFIQVMEEIKLKQGEEFLMEATVPDGNGDLGAPSEGLEPGNYKIEFWLVDDAWPDAKASVEFAVE